MFRNNTKEPGLTLRQQSAIKGEATEIFMFALSEAMEKNLVNYQPKISGMTALHRAVQAGNVGKVHLLKLAKADPELKNNANQTPLDLANELTHSQEREQISWLLKTNLKPCKDHPLCMYHEIPTGEKATTIKPS